MQIGQATLTLSSDVAKVMAPLAAIQPQLVLVFASVELMTNDSFMKTVQAAVPNARWAGCSTAGEISVNGVGEHTAVFTAVRFDKTPFRIVRAELQGIEDSEAAGDRLGKQFDKEGLKHVLLFGQGVAINGSALIRGLQKTTGVDVLLSGGLAGDNGAFTKTCTLCDKRVDDRQIVAIGLYGENISVGFGSMGGWQAFGPARRVTKSTDNVLYELDGEPALAVYKRYLGDYASGLPASGLLFPFSMLGDDHSDEGLIRTILAVNEDEGSLILAGDVVPGGLMKLMHASTDALVDGAVDAAEATRLMLPGEGPSLALLVSCVGRKIAMGARVEEEVEAVMEVLGPDTVVTGFYSNGEINPMLGTTDCRLHNQTMTISCLRERA